MNEPSPKCWKCGYTLTGLRVDDLCPECGTPVWSAPPGPTVEKCAKDAQVWGIISLALFFVCLGPLAGLVAIPAITNGRRALELERTGRVPPAAIAGARLGLICGSITAALSIAWVILVALFLLADSI